MKTRRFTTDRMIRLCKRLEVTLEKLVPLAEREAVLVLRGSLRSHLRMRPGGDPS